MKIKDRTEFRSKPRPMFIKADATVAEASAAMAKHDYGSVVVAGEDGRMSGLFTERDLLKRVVNAGLDPKTTPVGDVMTRDIRTARADDDVFDWLRIMSNERFRRLPIVDEQGEVIAIMTQGDFVSYSWPELFGQASAAAKKGFATGYQVPLIIGGILLYSIVMIAIMN